MAEPIIPEIPGNSIWDQYQPYQGGNTGDGRGANEYGNPYDQYLSAMPIMQRNMNSNIGQAISSLAPGTRYSGEAYRQAGNAAQNTTMDMNSMLSGLMYNQYNQDADRAMNAAQGLMTGGGMVEGALGQRYGAYSGALKDRMSAWEQQKAQQMAVARMQYADFEKNKYGTLPMLMGSLTNSIGQGPEPILSTSPGKQGYGDDIMRALALYLGNS